MQDSASDSVEKYKLKLKTEDGKDYDEEVEIDTKKETETFHVPKAATDEKEADIVLDFKKVSEVRQLHVHSKICCRRRDKEDGKEEGKGEGEILYSPVQSTSTFGNVLIRRQKTTKTSNYLNSAQIWCHKYDAKHSN